MLIDYGTPTLLSRHDSDTISVWIAEATDDGCDGATERLFEKCLAVDPQQVCAGELEWHAPSFVLDSVTPFIVFKIVL